MNEKRRISKKKYDWALKVDRLDRDFQALGKQLNREEHIEYPKDQRTTMYTIFAMGYVILDGSEDGLGPQGDTLLDQVISLGMSAKMIQDLKTRLTMLSSISKRLHRLAEVKYDGKIDDWPLFRTKSHSLSEATKHADAVKEIGEFIND